MSVTMLRLCRKISLNAIVFALTITVMPAMGAESSPGATGEQRASGKTAMPDNVFATVGDATISTQDFRAALQKGVRDTFYHGRITDKKMKSFKDKVAQDMVDRLLLLNEAKRRSIKPDPAKIQSEIDKVVRKYSSGKNWEKSKEAIIASTREKSQTEVVIEQLKEIVTDIAASSKKQKLEFYNNNLDKFVVPEKWNVSIILLPVDPSSPPDVWRETDKVAKQFIEQMKNGEEEFEELARVHSSDESAIDGGNMGYVHTGMLSIPAQKVLNVMDVGEISEPVILLKGIAIFRLNGIQGSKQNDYERVKEKVTNLLMRERKDNAWKGLIEKLRRSTKFEINQAILEKTKGR